MSKYNLKRFQENAVNSLMNSVLRGKYATTVFYAPTGAGKTVMMIEMMDRIVANNPFNYEFAFVWLTPGAGELEEQSWAKAAENFSLVRAQKLSDALFCWMVFAKIRRHSRTGSS